MRGYNKAVKCKKCDAHYWYDWDTLPTYCERCGAHICDSKFRYKIDEGNAKIVIAKKILFWWKESDYQ